MCEIEFSHMGKNSGNSDLVCEKSSRSHILKSALRLVARSPLSYLTRVFIFGIMIASGKGLKTRILSWIKSHGMLMYVYLNSFTGSLGSYRKLIFHFNPPTHRGTGDIHVATRLMPVHPSMKACTVKPVLSGHSKIDKTKVLKTNGSLMKVECIAECSLGAFCNTFDLHEAIIGLGNQFLSGRLRQVVLYTQLILYHFARQVGVHYNHCASPSVRPSTYYTNN